MTMSTIRIVENEFGSYADEVLDAGWLPPVPELQCGQRESGAAAKANPELDADSFLYQVYCNQT